MLKLLLLKIWGIQVNISFFLKDFLERKMLTGGSSWIEWFVQPDVHRFGGEFIFHSVLQLSWFYCLILQSARIGFVPGTHYAQWDQFLSFGLFLDESQLCSAVYAASQVTVVGSLYLAFDLWYTWHQICSHSLTLSAWELLDTPPMEDNRITFSLKYLNVHSFLRCLGKMFSFQPLQRKACGNSPQV